MAIDKNRTKEMLEEVNELLETLSLPGDVRKWIEDNVMGPAFKEIEELIEKGRPPVMYFIGRSGHGKSSLMNALANKKVAEVGDIKPTTLESVSYQISFEEYYSSWKVIDSRGLFETTSPNGGTPVDVVEWIKKDIRKYKPDVFLHVISAPEVRALQNDLKAFEEISNSAKEVLGEVPPTVLVLNKIDTLGNPRDWPPEKSPQKAGLIEELLNYIIKDVFELQEGKYRPININNPIKGYEVDKWPYVGVIPASSLEGDLWNIETLSELIGNHLPKSAQLDFFQAQRRKELLREFSCSIIKKFSKIAGFVGASPVPISDILILTPLQILMIAIIGGLSCKPFSKETAEEFMAAVGMDIGVGVGLRTLAQQLVKLIPGAGSIISGAIAAIGTYSIGKAAEVYFFEGLIKKPEEFMKEAEREFSLEERE